ncbi:hypothetical protein TruAng_001564 [Truncatella angustata]|nr:hypothetical protein TruAng_001564 [Truncatella angustata]
MVLHRQIRPEWWHNFNSRNNTQSSSQHSTATLVCQEPQVSIHPLATQEGVLIKVEPPYRPSNDDLSHVPCDIVLVIDVSWSMSDVAPVIGRDDEGMVTREHTGYSVLDITKHAALTVLETLDAGDRLAVVTFSTSAKVVRKLQPMDPVNKKATEKCIRGLKVESATNLWQGIVKGIEQFRDLKNTGRVPAVLVLTDGQPNLQDPLQGYVAAIRNMAPLPATVHTFGFGNDIKSGLLKSIAEIGGGSYSFIPDAGMVGTVFVNAVAHLQSTFANRCTLTLTFPESLRLKQTGGEIVACKQFMLIDAHDPGVTMNVGEKSHVYSRGLKACEMTIPLGNLQYGQSRDIYIRSDAQNWSSQDAEKPSIDATLNYSLMHNIQYTISARQDALSFTSLPSSDLAYHRSRAMVCEYLSSFFPLQGNGEHSMPFVTPASTSAIRTKFEDLLARIPAKDFSDSRNKSIMQDILGQIKLAVYDDTYLKTWAPHYFLSLWDAHAKQVRNTFKDPGVQMYDLNSPLFTKCQEDLTRAFDIAVEAPEPSLRRQADEKYSSGRANVSMSSYNNCDQPCFSASTLATLADGSEIPASQLRKGMAVQTPCGNRNIVAVLKTRVQRVTLCRTQNLLVTPWHPVMDDDASWTFPARIAKTAVRYSGAIYSILLEPDSNPQAHAIRVGGVWAVTLGHGIIGGEDVRAHAFLGDYSKVSKALSIVGVTPEGMAVASGVRRERRSGRLNGFRGQTSDQIGDC